MFAMCNKYASAVGVTFTELPEEHSSNCLLVQNGIDFPQWRVCSMVRNVFSGSDMIQMLNGQRPDHENVDVSTAEYNQASGDQQMLPLR